jgi:oxygen-dependent protoporphyrinogen oxidase
MSATKGQKVTIVGAGFSGLMSAFYLEREGFSVRVIESENRAGGLIRTLKTENGIVETAANGLLASGEIENVFREIGLEPVETRPEARKRFVFRDGEFRRWPLGLRASLKVISFLLKYAIVRSAVRPNDRETVRVWGERVLGQEASRYLLETALQGIYAGDPSRMSAAMILGRFFEKRSEKRGKLRGTIAPREGMGALISALESHLRSRGVEFVFARKFSMSDRDLGHPLVLAVSVKSAAELLGAHVSPLLPIVTTTAFFQKTDASSAGFGCLFPPCEKRNALGVLKNDFIFENRSKGLHSETWILGGANQPDIMGLADKEIEAKILNERADVFGLIENPKEIVITRWPSALPHYTLDLKLEVAALPVSENVFLIGNYLGSIGLSQILLLARALPEKLSRLGRWT